MMSHGLDLFDAIGLVGTGLILLAYALPQLGRLKQDDLAYLLINIAGATLVLISLLDKFNLSAFLLEVAWITISLYGIYGWWRRRGKPAHDQS